MKSKSEAFFINFFQKIHLKNHYFVIFSYIFVITKLLPLFIITHDWNILETKGLCKYLIELTIGPIIHRLNNFTIYIVILTILFLFSLIPVLMLILYYHRFKKIDIYLFGKRLSFKLCVWMLYLFPYLFSHYIFSFCVECFFIKQHHPDIDNTVLIIMYILLTLFILLCIVVSYFLSIISIGPYYTTGDILISNVNRVDTKWIFFSVCQGVSQLEFHVKFNEIIYIKCAVRGIFILYYVIFLFNLHQNIRCKNYWVNLIIGMCFYSSLGEFAVMYSFNDKLVVLTSNSLFILLKLFLEVFLSVIMLVIIQRKETNRIINFFKTDIEGKKDLKDKADIYPMFSKFLLRCSNLLFNEKNIKFSIIILNKFQEFLIMHKENCNKKKDCFCKPHKIEEIKAVFDLFVHTNETNPKKFYFSFKEFCPALFDYVEHYLINEINRNHTFQNGDLVLVLILFYMECDNNFNQSFYYLDKFVHTVQYKNSFVMKVQIELIKKKLKKKNKISNTDNAGVIKSAKGELHLSKLQFKNMLYYIEIEKEIKLAFDLYHDFLIKTTFNNDVGKNTFEKNIKRISKKLDNCKRSIIYYIDNYNKTNTDKCLNFQLCSKISLYFKFFYGIIPPKVQLSFEPLSNFYSLSKYNINENYLLISFSNTKGIQMNIIYLSDSLLVDLGYQSHQDLKLDNFNDILFAQYSTVYASYIINEVLKGNNSVSIPYILLRDKNHFLRIYDFEAIIVITDKCVYLFARLKNVNKYNSCYGIINNTGNIIGINQEFTNVFFLNMSLINKLNIVLFNDLLGLNFDEQNLNKVLSINTIQFYENINALNANLMFENNQEIYSNIYQSAKEAIAKLRKNPKGNQAKTLNIHLIPFSLTKDTKSNLFFIAYFSIKNRSGISLLKEILTEKNVQKENKKPNFQSSKEIFKQKMVSGLVKIEPVEEKKSAQHNKSLLKLSKDKLDLIEKMELIRELGFSVLQYIYGTSKRLIAEISHLYKNIHNYNDENIEQTFRLNQKATDNLSKKQIYFQTKLFIFVFLIYLFFIIFILVYKKTLYSDAKLIVDTQLYLIIAKKIYNSITTSVIGMVIQKNGLQPEYIDNNFFYDFQHYKSTLLGRIEDYIENFKKFRERFYSNQFQTISNLEPLSTFLLEKRQFVSMGNDYREASEERNLFEIFNYLHIRLHKLANGNVNPLSFNSSDNNYFIENKTNVEVDDSSDLEGDSICVFLLENALTTINYPLIEMINYFEDLINQNISKANFTVLILNLVNALIILILFVYQGFVYYNLANELFIKWFLNICNLKYFSLVLIQKTKMIKNVIDVGTVDKIAGLGCTKLKIANTKEESELISSLTQAIDEEFQFQIIPFQVITEIKDNIIPDNYKETLIKQANSEFSIDPNILKSPVMKRQFTQLQDEPKRKSKIAINYSKKSSMNKQKNNQTYNNTTNISSTHNVTADGLVPKKNGTNNNPLSTNIKDKKVIKEINNSGRILILFIFIILGAGISGVNYYSIYSQFSLLSKYSRYKTVTLLRSNYFHEILLCFHLTVLKNQEMFYEYVSRGHLNHSEECAYLNDIVNHNAFNETVSRFNLLASKYEEIVTDPSSHAFQKSLINFERNIRSDDACEFISKFLYENKDVLDIKLFVSLEEFSQEELVERCYLVGNGYNKKGIREAFNSLINYAIDSHKDFLAMKVRDEEYNYKIFQDRILQTYQVESNRLLELLFFDYQIALTLDYNNKKKSKEFISTIFLVKIAIILVIVGCVYLSKFTNYFLKMDNSIEKVKVLVFHTIIY